MNKFVIGLLTVAIVALMPVAAANMQGNTSGSNIGIDAQSVDSYVASLSAVSKKTSVGDTVRIGINVECESNIDTFSSGEIIISFDNSKLTFDKASSSLSDASVAVTGGELVIQDYGEAQDFGTVYTLAFIGKADGEAKVTLVSAAFSTKEKAHAYDLSPAEITASGKTVTLTVGKEAFSVSFDKTLFKGYSTVVEGSDYTFSVSDSGKYYDYGAITATVGGRTATVIDNKDGTYTVKNVTGNLVITGSRTPKSFEVSIIGETAENDGTKAVYGTDYKFVLKKNIPATAQPGIAYRLESITIGGKAYTGYTYDAATRTYTVRGSDIVGDISVTVSSAVVPINTYTVSVGGAAGVVEGSYPVTVSGGSDHAIKLMPAQGKVYSVTATMGGREVEVIPGADNTYTVHNITADVVFYVLEMTPEDNITVSEYLTIDRSMVWLVKNNTEKLDGVVYTVNGNNMLWSDKYNAYCFLIESPVMPEIELGTASEDALTVEYSMDVNISGSADLKDAETVYNMYNDQYGGITDVVTVENYLRADMDGSGNITVLDAVVIVYNFIGK